MVFCKENVPARLKQMNCIHHWTNATGLHIYIIEKDYDVTYNHPRVTSYGLARFLVRGMTTSNSKVLTNQYCRTKIIDEPLCHVSDKYPPK